MLDKVAVVLVRPSVVTAVLELLHLFQEHL
jgi:hypothetical protein